MVRLENVSFAFGKKEKSFFKDLSVDFASGALHFIHGKNGVGKSTLFRILQGMIVYDEFVHGTIRVGKQSYNLENETSRKMLALHIGVVQQNINPMLADQFSFEENLRLSCMSYYPGLSSLPKAKDFPELLRRFGIDITKPVGLLSGGQQQILAIMMALQKECSVLLLDEPTAALDDHNTELVMQFLNELVASTGLTVLMICHDVDLMRRYGTSRYAVEVSNNGVRTIASIA